MDKPNDNEEFEVHVETKWDDDGNMSFDVLGFDPDSPVLKFARDTVAAALRDEGLLGHVAQNGLKGLDDDAINVAVSKALNDKLKFETKIDENTTFTTKVDAINPGVSFGIKIKF